MQAMQTTFELADVIAAHKQAAQLYHQFLTVPAMSLGLYVLPAGGTDPQPPHQEDEIYYVVGGRAVLRVDDEDRPVESGSILYVDAGRAHHFHTIDEDLTVLVFFAPAHTPS